MATAAKKIPYGYCQCGCGKKTPLRQKSNNGFRKGEPRLYLPSHQLRRRDLDHKFDKILELYSRPGMSLYKLEKVIGADRKTIRDLLHKSGIRTLTAKEAINRRHSRFQDKAIELYRDGLSLSQVARKLSKKTSVSHAMVRLALIRNGHSRRSSGGSRKSPIREDFFSVIDTEAKAYIAGFIAADGCIRERDWRLSFSICPTDSSHLVRIGRELGASSKVYKYVGTNCSFDSISFFSRQMASDLAKLGITPRKSLVLKPNISSIPVNLRRHFWRGVVDGDGWVSLKGGVGLCGSKWTVQRFCEFIRKNIGGPGKKASHQGNELYSVSFSGPGVSRLICELLYSNSNISLQRKHVAANQVVRRRSSRQSVVTLRELRYHHAHISLLNSAS